MFSINHFTTAQTAKFILLNIFIRIKTRNFEDKIMKTKFALCRRHDNSRSKIPCLKIRDKHKKDTQLNVLVKLLFVFIHIWGLSKSKKLYFVSYRLSQRDADC